MDTDDLKEKRWEAAQEGAERIREGDVTGAITELEALIHAEPDNEYAYFFLGCAHFENQDFEKAMKAYVITLEKAPEYLGAMVHLGHTLRMLGRYNPAFRMGRQVLARRSGDPDALYLMALTHYARGEAAASAKYLELFLETNPELEAAGEAQGLLAILRGDKPDESED